MKVNARAKHRASQRPLHRATYDPDYSHTAWVAIDPVGRLQPKRRATRKQPHESLSLTQLRNRLSAAGVRGSRITELAREIKAGPGLFAGVGSGTLVMGWPTNVLKQRFGRRIARAVSRFVSKRFLMIDEAWLLLKDLGDFPSVLTPRRLHTRTDTTRQEFGDLTAITVVDPQRLEQ